ncbi:hypothetical protein C9E85_14760 [Plesiomonas shigelloides]|uniref:hypothetical protein n=1 Tax=Plesiomonas shigelloides TaxID=703 RepID=UPI000D566CA0|nr:hypothetical protein [Plesiomonas shigelloides]PVU65092.1 hypothetical protein C9E85_14760 [Plesiomonas shigelloides]
MSIFNLFDPKKYAQRQAMRRGEPVIVEEEPEENDNEDFIVVGIDNGNSQQLFNSTIGNHSGVMASGSME